MRTRSIWPSGPIAFEDASTALKAAKKCGNHENESIRYASVTFFNHLQHHGAEELLYEAVGDESPQVAVLAAQATFRRIMVEIDAEAEPLFRRFESLVKRAPEKEQELAPLVWPWCGQKWAKHVIGEWMAPFAVTIPLKRFMPYYRLMRADGRARVAFCLRDEDLDFSDPLTRELIFNMIGDPSISVRCRAQQMLNDVVLAPEEAVTLEGYLSRKSSDLRKTVLSLLEGQPEREALESVDRLVGSGKAPMRQGGLELLAQLAGKEEASGTVRAKAAEVAAVFESDGAKRKRLSKIEVNLLEQLKAADQPVLAIGNGLGLFDPGDRAIIPPVKKHRVRFFSQAAVHLIRSLDELIHEKRKVPVTYRRWGDVEIETLLGEVGYGFPSVDFELSIEENRKRMPAREYWEDWWDGRPKKMKDADALELFRAVYLLEVFHATWYSHTNPARLKRKQEWRTVLGIPEIEEPRYEYVATAVLQWLLYLNRSSEQLDRILDFAETGLASIPPKSVFEVETVYGRAQSDWRGSQEFESWLSYALTQFSAKPNECSDQQATRLWQLARWRDQPVVDFEVDAKDREALPRNPVPESLLARAYEIGAATEADVLDRIFVETTDILNECTSRKPSDLEKKHPWLKDFALRCRDRIMEVELARGDQDTPATEAAGNVRSFPGTDWFVRILGSLDTTPTPRGWGSNRKELLSTFLGRTYPTTEDSEASFTKAVKAAGFAKQRLIETAMFAPQWARFIEAAIGFSDLEDAVWWFHAHTKDDHWRIDPAVRDDWAQSIQERTPLTSDELIDGAVDVDWFQSVYSRLQKKRWEELEKVAKLASSGMGHARAVLFAKAMSKGIKKGEIVKRIEEKRNKDYVRALGLLPLAGGNARKGDLLGRYKILQEFLRTSKQFGAQRRESEKKAVEIGMANLARTAGYRDPLRLQWSMEREALADLAKGPVSVTEGETTVTLSIDERCEPAVSVVKGEKSLKSVPAKLKKNKKIKELTSRKTELRRQASRMRRALEEMMVRGDAIEGHELPELFANPLLAPMLEKLVFVGDGILGYPDDGGRTLVDFAGTKEPIKKDESLRLAHAHDLYKTRKWSRWQHDCFARERIQPFKQIFRELYPITAAEKKEKTQSSRYAGHQVNPSQAMALLGGRGWLNVPEEGVRKTFHDLGISVYLEFDMNFFTPAEVEGLTVETVRFTKRGEWKSLPLTNIPPVVFSEVMRDLDLAVSVAHRGGVDPEASASTVEMRATLLKETLKLVGVKNVKVKGNFAIIDGNLREYSVHLGSAIVRGMPGQMLYVVPVHAAHRGRLFLPFADDDPKTAEVISKVLLFAEDDKIKDPAILEQL